MVKFLMMLQGFNFYIKENIYSQKLAVLNRHIIKLSMIVFLFVVNLLATPTFDICHAVVACVR